jgi:hypothetical protein
MTQGRDREERLASCERAVEESRESSNNVLRPAWFQLCPAPIRAMRKTLDGKSLQSTHR